MRFLRIAFVYFLIFAAQFWGFLDGVYHAFFPVDSDKDN